MVPGLANRNGHRTRPEGNRQWGGKRVKSYEIGNDPWLEAGAKAVMEDRKLLTKAKYYELVTGQLKKGDQLSIIVKIEIKKLHHQTFFL